MFPSVTTDYYNHDFYQFHERLHPDQSRLAEWIARYIQPESVIDFGCGDGYVLASLRRLLPNLRSAIGVDGSVAAQQRAVAILNAVATQSCIEIPDAFRLADLKQPVNLHVTADLVVCLEVAEHLPECAADILVDTLCRHARSRILFSAAGPGQIGDGHVNLRSQWYWLHRFSRRGWTLDAAATAAFRFELAGLQVATWYQENGRVLCPAVQP